MRDSHLWSVTVPRAMSIYAGLVFVVLWVGFVFVLLVNWEWPDQIWAWALGLPAFPRILVWLLLLPIMVGLWIWQSTWPAVPRLLGFAGLAVWTLLAASSVLKAFGRSAPPDQTFS